MPLKSVDFIPTQPVAITGATTTVVTTTALLLPPNVQVYPGQPVAVTVTVNVEVLQTTLQLSVIPTVQGMLPAYNFVASPNKLEMTLSGTFSQLQGLSPSDVRAVIDAGGRGAGTYSLTPQITVPQGVKLVSSPRPDYGYIDCAYASSHGDSGAHSNGDHDGNKGRHTHSGSYRYLE